MNVQIDRIEKDTDKLIELTKGFDEVKCLTDDYLGMLLVGFFRRFKRHAKTIRLLSGDRDHLLIARSVIEGGFILRWVLEQASLEERKKRAKKYFDLMERARYVSVQDSKDMIRLELIEALGQRLKEKNEILKKGEKEKIEKGEKISFSNFFKTLTGNDLRQFAESHKKDFDEKIYTKIYSYMSGFHHWNSYYMWVALSNDTIDYNEETSHEREYVLSLMTAINVWGKCAIELSQRKRLDKEKRIFSLVNTLNRYILSKEKGMNSMTKGTKVIRK